MIITSLVQQSLQEAIARTQRGFVPSLAVDMNALHLASNVKYASVSRCCQTCVPDSRVRQYYVILNNNIIKVNFITLQNKFYSEKCASVGLRNMLVVDKRKQW